MTNPSTQELQRFIADNNLRRKDGLIVFHGTITICTTNTGFSSELLVVTLPEEMVVYVMDFGLSCQPGNDMYRTIDNQFTCLPGKKLEITNPVSGSRVLISLDASTDQY
jgi:hypothetical protein